MNKRFGRSVATMSPRGMSGLAVVALLSLALSGCGGTSRRGASTQPATQPSPLTDKKLGGLNRWLKEFNEQVPPATYRVQPPDTIRVSAPMVKELDKFQARLRPDGKITLNLVGDIYVAGMSPAEIAQEIVKRLTPYYRAETLHVSVDVTEFASKKYYVVGQVYAPGVKPYTGQETIVKVLAEAGLNEDAWPQKIVLVRPHENAKIRQKVTIDLKKMYESGDVTQNYLVEEGDLVFIPVSPLAQFRKQTERILAPIRPVSDLAMMGLGGF